MSMLLQVFLIGILPSIVVSLSIGGYLGHTFALRRHAKSIRDEREKTLKALQNVLQSAKSLSTDVDQHTSELQDVEKSVGEMPVHSDYEQTKGQLLSKISKAIQSNSRLEDDLVYTRFCLEEQAQELDRTREEARRDPLSGVGNRKAFDEMLSFMLSKYHRIGKNFALLLIDVDHFKWINDTHGHQSGDAVVRLIGETLGLIVHREDHVARYGGDEFAVFFEEVDDKSAMAAANRIRNGIDRTVFPIGSTGGEISVTLSMGLAVVSETDTAATLFEKSDKALYESKRQGRNRLLSYTQLSDFKTESTANSQAEKIKAVAAQINILTDGSTATSPLIDSPTSTQ